MKFPFLASVLIFLLVLHHNLRKGEKTGKKQKDSFWSKEYLANTTRKQSLEDLKYISFAAEEFFPISLLEGRQVGEFLSTYPAIKEILPRFLTLSQDKIVNLSHFTNTDLKFKYGIANFNLLSAYDENYIELVSLLHQYGAFYHEAGYLDQALKIFEYSISIGSDISETYVLTAGIYQKKGDTPSLNQLYQSVEKLPQNRKNVIFRKLKESGLYNG